MKTTKHNAWTIIEYSAGLYKAIDDSGSCALMTTEGIFSLETSLDLLDSYLRLKSTQTVIKELG